MTTRLLFNEARKAYGGSKNGLENELANFIYRSKKPMRGQPRYDIDKTVNLLLPAIEAQTAERKQSQGFVPPWKNFKTWINGQCWTQECAASKVAEQRNEDMKAKIDKQNRELYSSWIMEQSLETLKQWCNEEPNRRLKPLVAELKPDIIEYCKS